MVANLLGNRGTCELPCELLQPVLILKLHLIGEDIKYCVNLQDLEFFGWARRGKKNFLYK